MHYCVFKEMIGKRNIITIDVQEDRNGCNVNVFKAIFITIGHLQLSNSESHSMFDSNIYSKSLYSLYLWSMYFTNGRIHHISSH